MSIATRSPTRILGGNPTSGWPQTNEVPWTRGGQLTAALYSGNVVSGGLNVSIVSPGAVIVGSDVLICSGPGRLNTIYPLLANSGTVSILYDAHAVASGGPFALSGHKYLGAIPANTHNPLPSAGPLPIQVDVPFSSGLCINFRSGVTSCLITYTPEVVPAGSGLN